MGGKMGNLILNGSFELGLIGWQVKNVHAVKGSSHTGVNRSVLGGNNQLAAALAQEIRIARKRCYIFSMFAASSSVCGDLHVKITWLNKKGNELGNALTLDIPGPSLPSLPVWGYYPEITGVSPEEAKAALLTIDKDRGGIVSIDDIMFYEQTFR